jgi:transposase
MGMLEWRLANSSESSGLVRQAKFSLRPGQRPAIHGLTQAKVIPFFEKLPRCLVGIEACATAHHWGRRLTELAHQVKLMPPAYAKPYVKRQKHDAAER